MTDYRTVGVHQINKWLWNKLKDFEYLDFASQTLVKAFDDYGTGKIELTPIIPSQQMPEFTNIPSGAPFIVYGYSRSTSARSWHMKAEKAAFTVYDNNEERLRAIHGYLYDLLNRLDTTAWEVNKYLGASSAYDFKFIQVSNATGPEPFTQEGGRQGATVSVSYEYTYDLAGTAGTEGFGLRA